jgi:hypothetical protein
VTVYVDDWRERKTIGRLRDRVWSHLLVGPEDDIDELHEFAVLIGLNPLWFQGPPEHPWPRSHYDVTESRRVEAVRAGAVEITCREGARMRIAGRDRRIARSVELAEANGHRIEIGPNKMQCVRCSMLAIRANLRYGLATERPCPPPAPWTEPPDDLANASPGHMAGRRP